MLKSYGVALAVQPSSRASAPGLRTADDLVADLVVLRPWLRSKQDEAERLRRVPDETVERLDAIGAYSVTTPARYGGADFSAKDLFRIYEALGAGCGATSWTLWASTGGNLWSAAFPDAVVDALYEHPWVGNRTCAVGGSTRRLAGTARQVEGGWMIKGSWFFATGSALASHAYLAVYLDDSDDSKVGMVLVPKEDYVRLDDWDAIGLAATGSATLVIKEELFVPDARFGTSQALIEGLEDLRRQGNGLPPGGLARSVVVGSGNALGMAEHALEIFLSNIGKKSIAYSPYARQQDAPVTHLNIGAVKMQIDAARRIAEEALDELDRMCERGEDPKPADNVRLLAEAGFVWDTCATAIETLFKASGASAIARKQPLQLVMRNCRAGSLHAVHNIQTNMENYGRQLCGIELKQGAGAVLERIG